MWAPFCAGVVAGIIHVLAGPDHLVAIAPFAAAERRRAWAAGVRWGLGHTGSVAVIASAAFLLRETLPLERLSGWSEQLVGVVLIGIGLWTLRVALRARVHHHEHEHDGEVHAHIHAHAGHAHAAHRHGHAALGVGALHGLAGSSHLVGVLPALGFQTQYAAVAYVAGYGAGSIIAMGGFALVVGRLSQSLGDRTSVAYQRLLSVAGVAAIAVGLFWIAG